MKMSFLIFVRSAIAAAIITAIPTQSSASKSSKHPGHGRTIVKAPLSTNATSLNQQNSASQVKKTEKINCYICLETETKEAPLIKSCENDHLTHLECITEWGEKNNTCGLCREPLNLSISNFEKMKLALKRSLQETNLTEVGIRCLIAVAAGALAIGIFSNNSVLDIPHQTNSFNTPDMRNFRDCINNLRQSPIKNINRINFTFNLILNAVDSCKKYLNYPNQYCIDSITNILQNCYESLQAHNRTTQDLVLNALAATFRKEDEISSYCEFINPLQMIKLALLGN